MSNLSPTRSPCLSLRSPHHRRLQSSSVSSLPLVDFISRFRRTLSSSSSRSGSAFSNEHVESSSEGHPTILRRSPLRQIRSWRNRDNGDAPTSPLLQNRLSIISRSSDDAADQRGLANLSSRMVQQSSNVNPLLIEIEVDEGGGPVAQCDENNDDGGTSNKSGPDDNSIIRPNATLCDMEKISQASSTRAITIGDHDNNENDDDVDDVSGGRPGRRKPGFYFIRIPKFLHIFRIREKAPIPTTTSKENEKAKKKKRKKKKCKPHKSKGEQPADGIGSPLSGSILASCSSSSCSPSISSSSGEEIVTMTDGIANIRKRKR